MWSSYRRGRLLNRRQVRNPGHPDFAVGPRLFSDPLNCVVTVLGLVDSVIETAWRLIASSDIFDHHHVAALYEVILIGDEANRTRFLVVRRADQDNGESPRKTSTVFRRMVHIGKQGNTIP